MMMEMVTQSTRSKIKAILGVLLILPTFTANSAEIQRVNWGDNNYHSHGRAYNYGRGGWSYGGGWNGPNVIIQVPSAPYYNEPPPPPVCERVEVCNSYGDCWLERRCQ